MNCQNFESIVNDLVREEIIEATAREQALRHSSGCASCLVRLQEEQALTEGLRELKVLMRDAVASDEVEEKLALAFRSYHAAASGAGKVARADVGLNRSNNRSNRRYWNYAAAAGILLAVALGIAANRFWRPEFSSDAFGGSGEIAAPVDNPVATAPGSDLLDLRGDLSADTSVAVNSPARDVPFFETPIKRRPAKHWATSRYRVARSTVTVQSLSIMAPDAEVTTDFIAIAYSNASNVSEGGQVVRLELPRYAMARFGVPINEERYDERVKADVWVGADGLARAIRFVQ